jgi:peptidoglycan/LPS O-acetylase OafA/YrhL
MSDNIAGDSPIPPKNRIDELESIRGIAALLVVIYHIPNWNAGLFDLAIFRNSYLMVELFFVLSGFVIYKAYANNIHSKENLLRFQFLRFGRLYPVHLLFLTVFLLLEIIKYFADAHYGIKSSKTTPFVENSLTALIQQLFLVQAIGPTGNALSFNAPAWSISVEFYTYLLFGLIVLYSGRFKLLVFALLAVASCVILGMEPSTSGYSDLLRCIAGFFIGCCTARIADHVTWKISSHAVTLAVVALALFLVFKEYKHYDIVIYFLTAALVLAIVFSDDGLIKRMLRLRFFTWLGMISYSVYMSHSAILWLFNQVHRFMFKRPEIWIEGRLVPQLNFTEALISYVIIITLLLLVSNFVYHHVEKPFREKSRKVVFKMPSLPLSMRWMKW